MKRDGDKIEKLLSHKGFINDYRSQLKKILATGLSMIMAVSLLGGCGSGAAGVDNVGNDQGVSGGGTETGQPGDSTEGAAMGRYLEKVMDLSGILGGYKEQLFALQDGKLMITQPGNFMQISEDNGDSWRALDYGWFADVLYRTYYINDYAVGADGTIAIIYNQTEEDSETAGNENEPGTKGMQKESEGPDRDSASVKEEDTQTSDTAKQQENTDGQENMDNQEKSGNMEPDMETTDSSEDGNFRQGTEDEWMDSIRYQVLVVKPDGTQIPVKLPEVYPNRVWIKDDGRIFIGTLYSDLYEIMEDGSAKLFLAMEDSPQLVQFQDSYLIMDGWGYDSLFIYDLEKEEYIEDAVLNDFIKENYGDRNFNGGSWYDLFFFPGEDGVLYLAGEQGVHRHVIGGSAMEQIIDANLSTFGNPSYGLLGMIALGDNEFMALFTDARLVRFTYDPAVPTVPNERMKAYSLEDNTTLRQAIAIYQTEHPEAYVEYEIGMEEGSSVTREDALKKLNTQIMAGEGPDLLVLDDMPVDSYIEKGLLKDLAPIVGGLSGDEALYDNIVDAFRQDGKLYAIPCEVNLPMIMGKEKYVSQMKDLEGIADGIEALRQDNPEKDLLRICSPKAIMKNFVIACAPAWTKEDGEIDKQEIEEFLTQMKRIYDAQMEGLPEELIRQYEERDEDNINYTGAKLEDQEYYYYGMDEFNYLIGERQILAGIIGYSYAYAELTSVRKVKGFGEDIIVPMNGQSSNVFGVQTLTGINASSKNTEHAEGLLKVLLGTKDIASLGFPVNRKAFEDGLYPDDYESPDESYSTFGYLNEDGQMFTWEIYWFDEERADALREQMKTIDTPYVTNTMLEDAVYMAGVDYINGRMSLEEAVGSVEKNLAIYMAE